MTWKRGYSVLSASVNRMQNWEEQLMAVLPTLQEYLSWLEMWAEKNPEDEPIHRELMEGTSPVISEGFSGRACLSSLDEKRGTCLVQAFVLEV